MVRRLRFQNESGFTEAIKKLALENIQKGSASVFTNPCASPTGFPFKVLALDGSLSETDAYRERPRRCDLGYLRHLYEKPDGKIGYRCPAEPEAAYIRKGGNPDDVKGKKCLCNALLSNIGLGQLRKGGYFENSLVTSGDGIMSICRFLKDRTRLPGQGCHPVASQPRDRDMMLTRSEGFLMGAQGHLSRISFWGRRIRGIDGQSSAGDPRLSGRH